MVEHPDCPVSPEEQLTRVFHALSDPSRRKIIGLLREAESLNVSDIARAFSISLNGVSKHLKVLEAAGLVKRTVSSREHWIAVEWGGLQIAYDWLHFYRNYWDERLGSLAEYFQEEREKDE